VAGPAVIIPQAGPAPVFVLSSAGLGDIGPNRIPIREPPVAPMIRTGVLGRIGGVRRHGRVVVHLHTEETAMEGSDLLYWACRWACQPCEVEGRSVEAEPRCWNCGGPVRITTQGRFPISPARARGGDL
jgi:hypothetical protein